MNLSISNIAWSSDYDPEMYTFLKDHGFNGLEIAPTRIFPQNPYDHISEAKDFAVQLKNRHGLCISSMQSIWYGISESIFGTDDDRQKLIDYTKKAVDFAEAIGCRNLVFGCPKNRVIPSLEWLPTAYSFFYEIGSYAEVHDRVIALEPNPPYYNTNFINSTSEAFSFCDQVDCEGLKVNVDLGTSIHYDESIDFLNANIAMVNHIHISEPMLAPIEQRALHGQLKALDYNKFFSIEMKNPNDIELVKQAILYVKRVMA